MSGEGSVILSAVTLAQCWGRISSTQCASPKTCGNQRSRRRLWSRRRLQSQSQHYSWRLTSIMSTGKVYDNCSYKIGVLLVGFSFTDFRNLSGLRSFKAPSLRQGGTPRWGCYISLFIIITDMKFYVIFSATIGSKTRIPVVQWTGPWALEGPKQAAQKFQERPAENTKASKLLAIWALPKIWLMEPIALSRPPPASGKKVSSLLLAFWAFRLGLMGLVTKRVSNLLLNLDLSESSYTTECASLQFNKH